MGRNDAVLDAELPASRPQLRLHHFFALTAVAAALLAINTQQTELWKGMGFEPPRAIIQLTTAWMILNALLLAVAVTTVAYGIAWRRKGLAFFDQPGHWLLVEIAVTGLFSTVPAIATRWFFQSLNPNDLSTFPMTYMWLINGYSLIFIVLVPFVLNIYLGVRKCHELRWSLVFYFKAAARVLMGMGDLLVLPSTLNAAWRDRREQVPRDGGHWCGVFVQCGVSCMMIGFMLLTLTNMYYMFTR
jgi:hypothetical protein